MTRQSMGRISRSSHRSTRDSGWRLDASLAAAADDDDALAAGLGCAGVNAGPPIFACAARQAPTPDRGSAFRARRSGPCSWLICAAGVDRWPARAPTAACSRCGGMGRRLARRWERRRNRTAGRRRRSAVAVLSSAISAASCLTLHIAIDVNEDRAAERNEADQRGEQRDDAVHHTHPAIGVQPATDASAPKR